MATVTVNKTTYTVEPLYQWDLNQKLEVYGLSLATVPEVHFTNAAMDKAIVRQATMDAAGVIRAEVPNSLLQKPYTILAYLCTYAGSTFETQYKLEIPVKGRAKPADYTLVDDPEVYSFNALENQVANALRLMDAEAGVAATKYAQATSAQQAAAATYASAEQLLRDAMNDIDGKVGEAVDASVGALTPASIGAAAANANLVELVENHLQTLGGTALLDLGLASKIAFGSYTGTGKYGSANPTGLTFGFKPQMVMIAPAAGFEQTSIQSVDSSSEPIIMNFVATAIRGQTRGFRGKYEVNESNWFVYITWTDNGLRWYSDYEYTTGAEMQLNKSGTEYFYVAIG